MKYMDDAPVPHDRIHHLLFSHREVVEDLLRHIVRRLDFAGDGRWIDQLDWKALKRESDISTAATLDRRYRDIVWSVQWQGSPLYLILLLEFQSRPDRFMALRQLTYLSLFYEDLVKSGRIGPGQRLPPALPICLYNGDTAWRAPLSLAGLVAEGPKELRRFQPSFRYLLIEELKVPVDLSNPDRNAAGTVFAAQQIDSRARLETVLDAIKRWLPETEYAALRHSILNLVYFSLPDQLVAIGDTLLQEEFTMSPKERFAKDLEEYGQGFFTRGLSEGRAEGRSEGRVEGLRSVLGKQLRLKFGSLPAHAEARLATATGEQLEAWSGRVLVAATLDEVWA
jgi:hypothetical protein